MALLFANNNSLSAITSLPASITSGAMTLLSTQTASSSSTIDFTSGIDSTYDEYVFKFYDIHPSANITFGFQVDTGTNTNYNQTITSTTFKAYHNEAGGDTSLGYASGDDQAQGSAMQPIALISTSNDDSASGYLHLFDPSNTTFVKHFFATSNGVKAISGQYSYHMFTAGYINTTTAITRVQFKTSSGNIDSGVIKLYGIS
jgi:hypothetical protein